MFYNGSSGMVAYEGSQRVWPCYLFFLVTLIDFKERLVEISLPESPSRQNQTISTFIRQIEHYPIL